VLLLPSELCFCLAESVEFRLGGNAKQSNSAETVEFRLGGKGPVVRIYVLSKLYIKVSLDRFDQGHLGVQVQNK
jgi:hypothetical protein